MLAEVTGQLLARSQGSVEWLGAYRGLYHLAGSGAASRFEWAQEILNYDKNAHEHVVKEILQRLHLNFQPGTASIIFSIELPAIHQDV
jgi:dTDP-4-dehydrorhamnose reductase